VRRSVWARPPPRKTRRCRFPAGRKSSLFRRRSRPCAEPPVCLRSAKKPLPRRRHRYRYHRRGSGESGVSASDAVLKKLCADSVISLLPTALYSARHFRSFFLYVTTLELEQYLHRKRSRKDFIVSYGEERKYYRLVFRRKSRIPNLTLL